MAQATTTATLTARLRIRAGMGPGQVEALRLVCAGQLREALVEFYLGPKRSKGTRVLGVTLKED